MELWAWTIAYAKDLIENAGIIGGLVLTGLALHIDARVRHAETLIEITKQHRELWMYFEDHGELARLFDKNRDIDTHPLSDGEIRFANFLFLHLRASYGAKKARIHVLPEHVDDDWREIFSHPAVTAAWDRMKHLHDRAFVALVESYRNRVRPTPPECPASHERASSAES